MNFKISWNLSIYTCIWDGLSQKTISRYFPLKRISSCTILHLVDNVSGIFSEIICEKPPDLLEQLLQGLPMQQHHF